LIPANPPPSFADPDDFSTEFRDFVRQCLVKDPQNRPSANELLEHPFIQKGRVVNAELLDLVKEAIDKIERGLLKNVMLTNVGI
jgi:serine/threonine protein kinase